MELARVGIEAGRNTVFTNEEHLVAHEQWRGHLRGLFSVSPRDGRRHCVITVGNSYGNHFRFAEACCQIDDAIAKHWSATIEKPRSP